MEAIVAVYSDWGIGEGGTQPVVLNADRLHFRALTAGAAVLVGRRTMADFPGGKPLKDRENIVVTKQDIEIEDAEVVHSVAQALAAAKKYKRCLVIGGASVYRQFFPYIDKVYLTQIALCPRCDSFFPDLDADSAWKCSDAGSWLEEKGIKYRFCTYERDLK